MNTTRMAVFPSALGWMAAAWVGRQLCELTFGHRSPGAASRGLTCVVAEHAAADRFLRALISRLQRYAAGDHRDDFLDVAIDMSYASRFQRAVIGRCRRIAAGQTLTYGELAARAGYPRAARAVGQVMAANRFPLVVPCHRVVAAGGLLGGYSAPAGLDMKRRLLAAEGVAVARRLQPS